jgi:hypothetical protein
VDPLDDCWRRKANSPAQFRKVDARIVLEFGKNAPSNGIQEFGNF